MKTLYLALLVTASMATTALTWAGPGDERHSRGGMDAQASIMRHVGHALRELDLDEGQRDRIHALMQDVHDGLRANQEATANGMHNLRSIVTAEELDEDALALAAANAGSLAEERVMLTGQAIHSIMVELSPEQREALQAMGSERRERGKDRHSGRRDDSGS